MPNSPTFRNTSIVSCKYIYSPYHQELYVIYFSIFSSKSGKALLGGKLVVEWWIVAQARRYIYRCGYLELSWTSTKIDWMQQITKSLIRSKSTNSIVRLILLPWYNVDIACTRYCKWKESASYQTMACRQHPITDTADHSGQVQIASQSGRSSRVNRENRRSCFVQEFFRLSESCPTSRCSLPAGAWSITSSGWGPIV